MSDHAKEQARAQYESICEMLAAVDVDYDRLAELRGEDTENLTENDCRELVELIEAAGECQSLDDALERIYEDPLSVEVRSGWQSQGEELQPEEFAILLCTGGPAVRIRGELDHHGQPYRAWLEYQDWGTPWTQYFSADSDTLRQYASHFISC